MNTTAAAIKVLFIGQAPETVDFSDPALPPGFDAAKIHAGIATGMQQMSERGWSADLCLVQPDANAAAEVTLRLGGHEGQEYDCIVIGGGLRIPPKGLALFESLVNAVHRAAPRAAIAFNTTPLDTAAAAARALGL